MFEWSTQTNRKIVGPWKQPLQGEMIQKPQRVDCLSKWGLPTPMPRLRIPMPVARITATTIKQEKHVNKTGCCPRCQHT